MSINFDNFIFLKPQKINNIYISKLKDNNLNIKLRRKITISGVYREGKKYYMDLIFDMDNKKDVEFIKLYKKIEMESIKNIFKNYNDWMGIEDNLDFEDVYTSFRSKLIEENGINKITFNLLTDKKIMKTIFYNEDLEKISYKEIEEGDEISAIINFNGIKFGKKKFENQWDILQIKGYKENVENIGNIENIENIEIKKKECQINIDSDSDSKDFEDFEDSINIEDLEKLDENIEKEYKKYIEEESLKFID